MSTIYQTAETAAEAQRKVQAKARGFLFLKLMRVLGGAHEMRDLEIHEDRFEFVWGDDQTLFRVLPLTENYIVAELRDGKSVGSDKARLIASLLKEAR